MIALFARVSGGSRSPLVVRQADQAPSVRQALVCAVKEWRARAGGKLERRPASSELPTSSRLLPWQLGLYALVTSVMVSQAILFASPGGGARRTGDGAAGFLRQPPSSLALLPVANRPLILHVLQSLEEAGIEEVAVVSSPSAAGAVSEALGAAGSSRLHSEVVELGDDGGCGSVLAAAAKTLGCDPGPMLVHMGDSLSRQSLRPLIRSEIGDADALMLVERDPPTARGQLIELAARRLSAAPAASPELTPAGVFVLGPKLLETTEGRNPLPSCELEVMAAVERHRGLGGSLHTRQVEKWWRYGRAPNALLDANRFALEGLQACVDGAQIRTSEIQGGVVVDPTAELDSSIVRGPAIIGPGARLIDAYVGPYTAVGPDVMIEGAEVENSIILAGSSICHVGDRLESSVVGPKARVCRDFRLPKALRLQVGEGAAVSLV